MLWHGRGIYQLSYVGKKFKFLDHQPVFVQHCTHEKSILLFFIMLNHVLYYFLLLYILDFIIRYGVFVTFYIRFYYYLV